MFASDALWAESKPLLTGLVGQKYCWLVKNENISLLQHHDHYDMPVCWICPHHHLWSHICSVAWMWTHSSSYVGLKCVISEGLSSSVLKCLDTDGEHTAGHIKAITQRIWAQKSCAVWWKLGLGLRKCTKCHQQIPLPHTACRCCVGHHDDWVADDGLVCGLRSSWRSRTVTPAVVNNWWAVRNPHVSFNWLHRRWGVTSLSFIQQSWQYNPLSCCWWVFFKTSFDKSRTSVWQHVNAAQNSISQTHVFISIIHSDFNVR